MNGETVSLHEYMGRFVVLNFCSVNPEPPRLGICAELNAFHNAYSSEVAMLSVEVKAEMSQVEAFMRDYSVHYPVILDQRIQARSAIYTKLTYAL